MTKTNDPPLVASVALIPDSNEKADLDAPSDESGKLVVGQVPNISISETIVVADQAERLSLEVQEGDVAIQQDTTESFIFTGGANVEINWQLVQFDAVGGISGEDIAPRDIDGRNLTVNDVSTGTLSSSMTLTANDVTINGLLNGADTSAAAAGEALTSDGTGGFGFASVGGIEEVASFRDLPAIDPPQIAFTKDENEYYHSKPQIGTFFDLGNATFVDEIPAVSNNPRDIIFGKNGLRMYEVNTGDDKTHQYNLTEPFDISTASLTANISNAGSFTEGIEFNNDGSKFYEMDRDGLFQYNVSNPFEITSATLDTSVAQQNSFPSDMAFNDDGSKLYESDDTIFQLSLSTPFDITTASVDASVAAEATQNSGIAFSADGSNFYEIDQTNDEIIQISLATPFDITTGSVEKTIPSFGSGPTGLTFDNKGRKMFQSETNDDTLIEIDLVTGGWEEF